MTSAFSNAALLHAGSTLTLCALFFIIGRLVRRWDRESEFETQCHHFQGKWLETLWLLDDTQAHVQRLNAEIDQREATRLGEHQAFNQTLAFAALRLANRMQSPLATRPDSHHQPRQQSRPQAIHQAEPLPALPDLA